MDLLPISGFGNHVRTLRWMIRKNIQIVLRSHLSRVFAIVLGILVIIREQEALSHLIRLNPSPGKDDYLILFVTFLTIAAALWELRGNKLSTSPQEVRFVRAMRTLLIELEKFISDIDKGHVPVDRLDEFINNFLEATCHALCGNKLVDGGFMVPSVDGTSLELIYRSKKAHYPDKLIIPIPTSPNLSNIRTTTEAIQETGPAGVAYYETRIVHMPVKKWKLSWPMKLVRKDNETYEAMNPWVGWVRSVPEMEKFRSVLCVPVTMHKSVRESQIFGVLNFSTLTRDPFVSRDYMMAECFGSILAQAISAAQRRKAEADQKRTA